ncbi:MAG: 4'-phosphopantetheinyl transferase family protein [Acidobacteriota bacterium]
MARKDPTEASLPAVQLWIACPADLLDDEVALACSAVLSEDERRRASRFHFDRHRREYLATHALARVALAHNHPLAPAAWRFVSNPHGKPAADPGCGLRFNLSNAQDLVVCMVARGAEVGVDVERIARAAEIVKLAPRVFSPAEQAQLAALPAASQLDRALSLWVLKEAYIKARGLGLSMPLKGFSFLFGGAEHLRLVVDPAYHPLLHDAAARWRFSLLDHGRHRIALMVETKPGASADEGAIANGAPLLELWEARPPLGPASRLPNGAMEWFPRA